MGSFIQISRLEYDPKVCSFLLHKTWHIKIKTNNIVCVLLCRTFFFVEEKLFLIAEAYNVGRKSFT